MGRLFGTDGVRGLANGEVLTPDLALALARSAARELGGRRVVIGRDTRPSGPMLEAAAAAGFASAGLDVLLLGVVPTPTVAFACASGAADLGLVISASHNAMPDNGLKLFGPGGHKLSDATEDVIEAGLAATSSLVGEAGSRATGLAVGRIHTDGAGDLLAAYSAHLLESVEAPLTGLRLVVDGAQGAASTLAQEIYRKAGAEVVAIFCDADGAHINDGCGATHLEALQAAVLEHRADLGIAHDGDADRCLAVDASGQVVDGDQVLAICALGLQARGLLTSGAVVATVMSNLGLHHALRDAGVAIVSSAVGDRYVLEQMQAGGHSLGGEQSGHLVFGDLATTGDGLLTALAIMGRMQATGQSLAALAGVVQRLPQVLVNVRASRERAHADDVLAAVALEQAALAGTGRVLLRPSGTEALVRVMVEAPDQAQADEIAQRLAVVVAR